MSWRALVPVRLGGCPAGWELSRALLELENENEGRDLAEHLGACRRCADEWRSLGRARAAVRALPRRAMSDETFDLIETRLRLGLAAPAPSARREAPAWPKRTGAIALICGVAAVVALVWGRARVPKGRAPDAGSSWASIRAVGDTVFSRAPLPEDSVRLESGTLEVDVGATPPGRRFRVTTDDAVVESAESRFSVEAQGHMLVAVRVFAGYAEVRARGGHAVLRAGDEWVYRGTHAAADIIEPPPSVRRAEHAPRSASFERAWRLLDAGRTS